MTIETMVWRRVPVRGPGRFVIPRLTSRASRTTVICEGPFGTRIAVDPRNAIELSMYLWGTYAPEVEEAVRRLARPATTVIDVGAGTGVFAALMGVAARPGRVLAIEAAPEGRARVAQQAELNGLDVEIIDGDPGRLDDLLAAHPAGPVSLLRIMLGGGGEPAVLRGSTTLLTEIRPAVIFDWCDTGWPAAREDPAPIAELLTELGYELYRPVVRDPPSWSVGPSRFERYEPASLDTFAAAQLPGGNLIALPTGAEGHTQRALLLGLQDPSSREAMV